MTKKANSGISENSSLMVTYIYISPKVERMQLMLSEFVFIPPSPENDR